MGYSCTKLAGDMEKNMSDICYSLTGLSNRYVGENGQNYFYEIGRENNDGAITGTVYLLKNELAYKRGTFRIEPNGIVSRKPLSFPMKGLK